MTKLLLKIFVKPEQYTNFNDPHIRQKFGRLSGITGIICNLLLFIVKIIAGVMTSAISIIADAFNNLSDAGSSIVTLIGFKISCKPADTDHPYGHGRIEYVSGMLIACFIIVVGAELFRTSADKIFHPDELKFSAVSLYILIFSLFVKAWLSVFNKKLSKTIKSKPLMAASKDSFNDCIVTLSVLTGFVFSTFSSLNIDGILGCCVALFVIWSGLDTLKDTVTPLLGQAPDPELIKRIKKAVLSQKDIHGVHDIRIHDYGPGRLIISLHAEISSDLNVIKAHEIIDKAENNVKNELNCDICIHMDPIFTNDPFTLKMKAKTEEIIKNIDDSVSLHDFRISKKNVYFDVLIPFGFRYSDKELIDIIKNKFKTEYDNYNLNIQIDNF